MPCYLFTFHAYRSWMPDRQRGFVKRRLGLLAPNQALAADYEQRSREEPVAFSAHVQRLLIEESLVATEYQDYRIHGIATDPSHLHVLLSWKTFRAWMKVRSGLKESLTRKLNAEVGRRSWFVESASRKRVSDRGHFDHLMQRYLASHRGWKWCEERGYYL